MHVTGRTLLLLSNLFLVLIHTSVSSKREAFVVLFYGNDEGFLLGTRVLGQSLKEAHTTREMVVMCPPSVSDEVKLSLVEDGWSIVNIDPSSFNYEGPFKGHVMKLSVLTLTQFTKVALLDTDVTAYEGIDDIFNCGQYCAVMRHSNIFNSGVMVLTPNIQHFNNILQMLESWEPLAHSHKGGDQDILNAYFNKITLAATFNKSDLKNRENVAYAQLPFEYNMDAGMYYLRDEWLIQRKDYRFLHYTLGGIRPWQWFTYPLFDLNWTWQRYRSRLNDPGRDFFTSFWIYVPIYLAIAFSIVRITTFNTVHRYIGDSCEFSKVKTTLRKVFPTILRNYRISFIVGFIFSILISLYSVPSHLRPFQGWSYFIFLTFFFACHVVELHYVILHYGCSATLERPLRNLRLVEIHLKVVLFSLFYVLFSLNAVLQIEMFSTRVKTVFLLAVIFCMYIYLTIQYLAAMYIQYVPSTSPMSSPAVRDRKDMSHY